MGTAPPPDAPPPEDDASDDFSVSADVEKGEPVASLCGFSIPSFIPKLAIKLPPVNFPPSIPFDFSFSLGINCSAENPLDVGANVSFGGGRDGTGDPDPDDEFDSAAA